MLSSVAIEKKIRSFGLIEDIVNAMKAYAGIVIRRTEELVTNIRAYEDNVLRAMAELAAFHPGIAAGSRSSPGGRRILVVFGSSQGLCGPFNEKIADSMLMQRRPDDSLFVVGRILKSSLEARGAVPDSYVDSIVSVNGIQDAMKDIVVRVMEMYRQKEFYRLTLVFTTISDNRPDISVEQILPPDMSEARDASWGKNPPLLYLDPEMVLEKMLEELLYISLYRSCAESLRSENWYRMRSMEGAHRNLQERISEFDSLRKYVRQEEITEEMLEIMQNVLL